MRVFEDLVALGCCCYNAQHIDARSTLQELVT